MLTIKKSPTADTRTCDVTKVTKEDLLKASMEHIGDVNRGLWFFAAKILQAAVEHDADKITAIDQFYADFQTKFVQQDWWTNHRRINRHHINYADGVPADVNLVDVIEHVVDCVMAGMARSGEVYPLHLDNDLLQKAFQNTVELLKANVRVVS
jgi:hypothetical protein